MPQASSQSGDVFLMRVKVFIDSSWARQRQKTPFN